MTTKEAFFHPVVQQSLSPLPILIMSYQNIVCNSSLLVFAVSVGKHIPEVLGVISEVWD